MNHDDHAKGVGAIITNLQSLETVIRIFLAKADGQDWALPSETDEFAEETYLTNYRAMGPLVDRYNTGLSDIEQHFSWIDQSSKFEMLSRTAGY